MKAFAGTGVALVTPFDENSRIDEESLRRLVCYGIDGNVDFLVALGTTAETPAMSVEEKERVVRIIADENKGRLPLMAGMGGNNTQALLKELQTTSWLDLCDGILTVTPYYNKPSQQGLYEHFKAVGEVAPKPVFLYNVPGRTGINMTAATTVRLSRDCPNIAGIKEASGAFAQATEIVKEKKEGFLVLSGDDGVALPLMSVGFDGLISVIANALPRETSALVRQAAEGKYVEARKIHFQLAELFGLLFAEGNPAGVKALLHIMGIIRCNKLRLPLTGVSEGLYLRIQEALSRCSRDVTG